MLCELRIWNPKVFAYCDSQIQRSCGNFKVFARKSIWKHKIASPEGKLSSDSETDEEYGR